MDAALASVRLDDVPVSMSHLAKAMGVSRWTVTRWKEDGYVFEFGRLTTPGHLKTWLRERALGKSKPVERMDAALERLK
jgi:hypothetical protein